MNVDENFELRTSKNWYNFCHRDYLRLSEVRRRLGHDSESKDWKEYRRDFLTARKFESILFPVKNLGQTFYLFQSDFLFEKFLILEKKGRDLYRNILKMPHLESDLVRNCNEEEAVTSAIFEGASYSRSKGRRKISLLDEKPKSREDARLLKLYKVLQDIPFYRGKLFDLQLVSEIYSDLTGSKDPNLLFSSSLAKQRLQEVLDLVNHHERRMSSLIKGAILHYFIMNIVPFRERNSEMARIIFYFIVSERKNSFLKFLSVSASLYTYKSSYKKSFEEANAAEGDLTHVVNFFLNAIGFGMKNVQKKVTDVLKVYELTNGHNLNDNQILAIQKRLLNKHRPFTYEMYMDNFSVDRETAKRDLKDLLSKEFFSVSAKTGTKYYYINVAEVKN